MDKMARIKLMHTGVVGFDEILGGGLPSGSLYLIQGLAGSGKTTLACQIGFLHAKQGEKVVILTLIAESHVKMLNHFSNFSFFDESLVGERVMLFGGYASLAQEGLRGLLKLITGMLTTHKPGILIIDGFRSVRNSGPSDLDLAEFMHSLNSLVSSMVCTTFLISPVEGNVNDSENTLVDGVIELSQRHQGMRPIREIKIYKVRGADHLLGKHVFKVKENGVVIFPRIEAISTRSNLAPAASTGHASVGIPSWDQCIGGGVVRGSVTCLLGSPGVGKTLMGLHFIEQGLRDNERCLVVGFDESPPSLIAKAEKIGLELTSSIADENLEIMWCLPLELLIDEVASRMLDVIKQRGVTRLLIDGLDGFRNIAAHPERAVSFLIALMNELRVRGVTTFVTEQLPYFGSGFLNADSFSSVLYDNIMLLEYEQADRARFRKISVMKLRENGYEMLDHQMHISDAGISVTRAGLELEGNSGNSAHDQLTDDKPD